MFINHTNHPSALWNEDQRKAATLYGEIVDMPFPEIDPHWGDAELNNLVLQNGRNIVEMRPDMVLCQGEFVYSFRLIEYLKNHNIRVAAACSERIVKERQQEDGTTIKEAVFQFVQFRKY